MAESFVWLVTSELHPDWSLRVVAYSETQALFKARHKPAHVLPAKPRGRFTAVQAKATAHHRVESGPASGRLPFLAELNVRRDGF